MITILSPAKTLNMDSNNVSKLNSQPLFIEEASELIEELRKYSPPEMEGLLKVNENLAEVNFMRHAMWNVGHDLMNSKQAMLAYNGAVYQGLQAETFDEAKITEFLIEELDKQSEAVLINLASNEYSSVIDKNRFRHKIITPVFKEYKQGAYKNVTIYAKRARGLMKRYIVENNIDEPEVLKDFAEEGYQYCKELSTDKEWLFIR